MVRTEVSRDDETIPSMDEIMSELQKTFSSIRNWKPYHIERTQTTKGVITDEKEI